VSLPAPHEALSDSAVLMEDERRDLTACELAVDHLRVAFWAAGKALQTIRDGHLYREEHNTFEDYAADRWQMSRRQAYRLIEAWPLAERIGVCPIGHTVTESQVRALLPVARKHGQDVAAEVYQTVAGTEGVRVTAALLADVARALPADADGFEADAAAEAVRSWLGSQGGGQDQGEAERPSAVEELAADVGRLTAILRRVQQRGTVERAAAEDAEAVRRILGELAPFGSGPLALGAAQD
jgi:hypothetical protein